MGSSTGRGRVWRSQIRALESSPQVQMWEELWGAQETAFTEAEWPCSYGWENGLASVCYCLVPPRLILTSATGMDGTRMSNITTKFLSELKVAR